MKKVLFEHSGKKYYVNDISQDYHTQFGFFKAADLKKKPGTVIETNTGVKATIGNPFFADMYRKIQRGAQIVPLKDLGVVIAKTGMGKDAVVVDAGSGSGACALFFAHVAKKVTTYEIREDFYKIVKKNIEDLEMKNCTIKLKDVKLGIDEKNVDIVFYDLPDPWQALDAAKKALKVGGFLVSYSPTVPQVMDFVKSLEGFTHLETIEILERQWEVIERKVRPLSQQIGHSGFLTFARKM
ncbi:MAG: methyltransferase domain-containing protein [Nanoarchaeota archaeon]|nr:methyltransferase domain-containing protein [Nanoarchaeota archaeon]